MTDKNTPLYACPDFGILMNELNSQEEVFLLDQDGPNWMTLEELPEQ